MRTIRAVGRFLGLWASCAFVGRTFWMTTIKILCMAATLLLGSMKLAPAVAVSYNQGTWNPSIVSLVAIGIGVIWVSVALGAAWAHFHRSKLRIEDQIVFAQGHYQVRVHNDGWGTSEGRLWVMRLTDANGQNLDQALPIEVRWLHADVGRPQIGKDISAIASILDTGVNLVNHHRLFHVLRLNGQNYTLSQDIPWDASFWVKLSARDQYDAECSKWFMIDPMPQAGDHVSAIPPFEQTRLSRIWDRISSLWA